ncbi:MAG: 2',3'-cyclic-nucleotide 2'-phosphodiesterase, partial [Rhodobacteraceae bacterium]|nr:2',3'-cyclic-nucleotide 2'-phosphodiesterase [Paracoccaceae bacterium]
HLEGSFHARDILEAARAWVPQLREEGADLVIALSHSGIDAGPASEGMENASFHLAGIEGIDAVVTGHAHRVWPGKDYNGEGFDAETGTINGKPAVMAGFWGSHLGLIELMLERDGTGWRIAASQSAVRPIYERGEDRKIAPLV